MWVHECAVGMQGTSANDPLPAIPTLLDHPAVDVAEVNIIDVVTSSDVCWDVPPYADSPS